MRYVVDDRCVTHDRLQDEVIIINLTTGSYYSGSGPAADLWTLLARGASVSEAAKTLASAYACDEGAVRKDVDGCTGLLLARGLLQENNEAQKAGTDFALPPAERRQWVRPDFEEYTDMWDLIKLDPIHDADEAGWPIVKP